MLILQKILLIIILLIGLLGIILNYLNKFSQKPLGRFFNERNIVILVGISILVWIIHPVFSIFYMLTHLIAVLVLLIIVLKLKQYRISRVYIIILLISFIPLILMYVITPLL